MLKIEQILELDLPIFHKAYKIALKIHWDDKRKDGQRYMYHVDSVIENVFEYIDGMSLYALKEYHDYLSAVLALAALHDTVEDHPDKISFEYIDAEIGSMFDRWGVKQQFELGIRAITKKLKGQESYVVYVLRLVKSEYATIVKRADLKHNMSDLKPGSMLDKYQLTEFILESSGISLEYIKAAHKKYGYKD